MEFLSNTELLDLKQKLGALVIDILNKEPPFRKHTNYCTFLTDFHLNFQKKESNLN